MTVTHHSVSSEVHTEADVLVLATKLLLMAADIPEACIPEETIRYYLERGMTPEQIAHNVWQIPEA